MILGHDQLTDILKRTIHVITFAFQNSNANVLDLDRLHQQKKIKDL